MIDVLPVDTHMLEPPLQGVPVHEVRDMSLADFPRDPDVESKGKDLVELVPRDCLGTKGRTARTVVQMKGRMGTWKLLPKPTTSTKKARQEPGLVKANVA